MKDANGLYYHPNAQEMAVRVYVRQGEGLNWQEDGEETIEFRLWHKDHAEMWERHGWVPFEAILLAAEEFKSRKTGTDPLSLYDINVAKALIKENERNKGRK